MTTLSSPDAPTQPLPSEVAVHEAGHAVVGTVLGIVPRLVSIAQDETTFGRVEHDPLLLGDLSPDSAADVGHMRRQMVMGAAGGAAMVPFFGHADDDGTGIVERSDIPSGRLMLHGGDAKSVADIADYATDQDPIATMVLTLEIDVLTDLLVSEPVVQDAIARVAHALDDRTSLTDESVFTLTAALLADPPSLAKHLTDPPECRIVGQEVDAPGFLDIPETAAAELLRRALDYLPPDFDIAVLDLDGCASAQDTARAVAARAAAEVLATW